jgi:D-aminopeptidase
VRVGHCSEKLMTGVTAILPLGNPLAVEPTQQNPYGQADDDNPGIDSNVLAAWFTLNGDGEMTGTTCIEESGFLEGPIMLTNTVAVGTVRNAVIKYAWMQQQQPDPDDFTLLLPVVAETYDGWLSEILEDAAQVTEQMVNTAIQSATSYSAEHPAPQGNVGSGKSMTCYSWKGGIGSSSRAQITLYDSKTGKPLPHQKNGGYTVGVLVQANQGTYWDLVIRGVPVGTKMTPPCPPDAPPPTGGPNPTPTPGPKTPCPDETGSATKTSGKRGKNSIIVVIATDAPLLPSQLKRLARRASLGIGRTGTITNDDSGEIFIAFSTNNTDVWTDKKGNQLIADVSVVPNESMDPLFEAIVNATEEAIINALLGATTLTGRHNRTAWSILDPNLVNQDPPVPSLESVVKEYNRLKQGPRTAADTPRTRPRTRPKPRGQSRARKTAK